MRHLIAAALLLPAVALADEAPLSLPDVEQGNVPDTEVNIVPMEGATVEEYRVGGRLTMVKIIPRNGPPYYLIDTDGDGELDNRRNDLSPPNVNQWILFRW